MPIAICALIGFVVAAFHAIRHLRTGDPIHDVRSYVSIHMGVIFGIAALLTGAIWARAAWGKWWVWEEPTLVSFLIVYLLYATYYPLRYAIEDRERQARYASVFAITAGAFVPLNFMAVRLAESLVHPRVFATADGGLPAEMLFTFLVCARRDGAPVRDAGAASSSRPRPTPARSRACAARSTPMRPLPARSRIAPGAGGGLADARAAARRGGQVRRRRLRGLRRACS